MELHKAQSIADIILKMPLIMTDGSQAIGEDPGDLFTKIIAPDGSVVAGYDEATFTEPNGDGIYVAAFPKTAANLAFTIVDDPNAYSVALDSVTADVDPTNKDVFILSLLPWEVVANRIVTIHVEDTGALPIPDVSVQIKDSAGLNIIGTGITDVSGNVILALNDGDYQAVLRKAFVDFTVPELFTVTADETFDFVGTDVSPSAPTRPDTCVIFGVVIDDGGTPIEDAEIFINETDADTFANTQKVVKDKRTTSDVDGFWELEIIRSSQLDPAGNPYEVIITAPSFKFKADIVVPDQDSAELSTLV